MSKKANEAIFQQGETINNITVNFESTEDNIKKGTEEVKEAMEISEESDSFINKACYASIIIVFVLLIMMLILPK